MLKGKTIYCIVTGAHRTTTVAVFLNMLKNNGAENVVLIPTPAAMPFLDLNSLPSGVLVRYESNGYQQIPEEDIIVVAPCTFDTFSKIVFGIADNYALSIVHAAIGKKKPVIVAPSMGTQYWWHPIISGNLKTLAGYGVEVIWPEYIYEPDGTLQKISMAPWQKIFDRVCHKYQKLRYDGKAIPMFCQDFQNIISVNYPVFAHYGNILQQDHYTNAEAGFLALRMHDGKILITRTGAMIGNIDREDLTIIRDCNEENFVSWSGKYPPSSETPLVIEIFKDFPNAGAIIHGHCKDITYSPKLIGYLSKEYLAYGQWGELFKIRSLLKEYGYAIMKLHGEIVIGKNFNEALSRYRELYEKTL